MVIAIMRGAAPASCLETALDPDRDFNVPMAPELGLFLVGGRGFGAVGAVGGARASLPACLLARGRRWGARAPAPSAGAPAARPRPAGGGGV
jgi:hypothetical protein